MLRDIDPALGHHRSGLRIHRLIPFDQPTRDHLDRGGEGLEIPPEESLQHRGSANVRSANDEDDGLVRNF
jgi:hypothetical protein